MSNIDLWRNWMRDASSPETFIEFGWYYIIGSALQRRVWVGPEKFPIFPNEYIIFVGDSGVGKGLVLRHVSNVLKYHKIRPENKNQNTQSSNINGDNLNQEDANLLLEMQQMANEILMGTKPNTTPKQDTNKDFPFVIPIAPDSVTYEQLVHRLSKSTRGICYKVYDESSKRDVQKIYTYTSLCFCLEEIGSLLRKRTEDAANFLLNTWDCGDYIYETKTSGIDRIRKCCLSLLAGTTPTFMRRVFSDELLAEGIASRTIFIYEYANRFNRLRFPEYTKEQLAEYKVILEHVKKLTTLYGQAKFTQEADEWLNKYLFEDIETARTNHHMKLGPYYAKKNLHLQKICMAIHFSDCTTIEQPIGIETCMKAARALETIEKKMHFAVSLDNKNPLAQTARNVYTYLKRYGKQKPRELLIQFYGDVREAELKEIIQYLISTQRIEFKEGFYQVKTNGNNTEFEI